MEEKEKKNPFFRILFILFLVFIAFYIALESGYYPNQISKKTLKTNEEVQKFEVKIKNRETIKKSGYIEKDVNYSNALTKTGNALTYSFGKVIFEGVKGVKKTAKILFW